MVTTAPFVVLANTVAVALGLVVTHVAYRAHQRTDSQSLLWLAVGFGMLTVAGTLGFAGGLTDGEPSPVTLGKDVVTAVGFGVFAFAVYRRVD